MEILEPDSIHHNLSPRRPPQRGVATYRSPQWIQEILLLPAVGQACCATISTISAITAKHKRTCVLFEQRADPSLRLSCIIITFELQS